MEYPILALDEQHNHASGSEFPSNYILSETEGIIIVPNVDLGKVNMLQVVQGENAVYYSEWDGKISITLNADTLLPMQADKPFSGFTRGRTVIAMGELRNEANGQAQFYVSYALLADFS